MKENNDGILAVIESGESCASIEAYRAGRNNDNYAVYPIFNVVNMDFIYLSGGDTLSTVPAFQNKCLMGIILYDIYSLMKKKPIILAWQTLTAIYCLRAESCKNLLRQRTCQLQLRQ